jgi:PAS domain S-box-containing protein
MTAERSRTELAAELEELRSRLAEAQEALSAIRSGGVDALVVAGEGGEQVYTLSGADRAYRQLIETMSQGAATLSADGVILYANARVAEILGRPLEEVIGTALRDYLPPDAPQEIDSLLARAAEEPRFWDAELVGREGRRVPVYLSASRLLTEVGPLIVCLVFTDLTEQRSQKRADEKLRSAKTFLDNVINAIADPVFVKDDKRRFVLVNDALCAIVGQPREELLGRDGDDQFPAAEVAVFREMDAGVLETGKECVNEELLSDLTNRQVRTIVTRKTRYVDPAGGRFLVGVIRDVTLNKESERRIEGQLEELQRWQEVMLDREDRIQELKREVNALCSRLSEGARYASVDAAPKPGKPPR